MNKIYSTALICIAINSGIGQTALLAREVSIAGPAQLKSLDFVRPGDIVTLKNGNWMDAAISLNKGGDARNRVVIKAETPGGVILGGSSSLEINAPYVTVDGLYFLKGTTAKDSLIRFNSHHGVLSNTAIVDYNPAAFETKYYWVFFSGDDNLVNRCYFKGKNNLDPLIGNAIELSRHNGVTRSYFKNIPYNVGNGREVIRVWGSGKFDEPDTEGAFFNIEGNLFDHADGEGTEMISLKSNHNVVQHNTVIATRGGINIRRGNYNIVKENVVLGQNREGAQGLRMSGQHNTVQGNYVSGCEYGIRVSCGEYIEKAITPSYKPDNKEKGKKNQVVRVPTYPQNRDLTLADNVVVSSTGPDLEIGFGYKNHWPESQQILMPEECLIKNNRFMRPKGGQSVIGIIPDTSPPLDHFKFKPNQYVSNILMGGTNAYEPSATGFKQLAIPPNWSEKREPLATKPLTSADVGPDWVIALRKAGNFPVEDAASSERPVNRNSHDDKKKKDR